MSPLLKIIVAFFVVAVVARCQAQQENKTDETKADEAATKKAVTAHWLGVADSLAKDSYSLPSMP